MGSWVKIFAQDCSAQQQNETKRQLLNHHDLVLHSKFFCTNLTAIYQSFNIRYYMNLYYKGMCYWMKYFEQDCSAEQESETKRQLLQHHVLVAYSKLSDTKLTGQCYLLDRASQLYCSIATVIIPPLPTTSVWCSLPFSFACIL